MIAFLEFSGAAGSILHIRLPQSEPFASCFLPDQVEDNINLCPFRVCKSHSTVRLQIYAKHLLLSVWDGEVGPVSILAPDGTCTEVPGSTHRREILFLLTDSCQFLSPASRWKIDFYNDEVISGLMKPPPLPCRTVQPQDLAIKALDMLAKDEDIEKSIWLQNGDLSLVEESTVSEEADKSIVPVMACSSMSSTNDTVEQLQNQRNSPVAVESRIYHSPKQQPESSSLSVAPAGQISATPQRKKLVDMEENENIELRVSTPRPRKRVRFNSNVDKQNPATFADLANKTPLTSPQQAHQDIFRREPGEESPELPAPEDDILEDTEQADTPDMTLSKNQSKAMDRRHKVWPFSFRGLLPGQPGVVFSSNCTVQTRRKTMSTFAQLGGIVVNDVDRADILCIPDGPLKRTTKFVLAITLGKVVVVEDWVVLSTRRREFQCIDKFIPKDKIREQQWGFSVLEAMKRDSLQSEEILKGWKVCLTPQLKKDLGDIATDFEKIAKALGASKLHRGLPKEAADPKFTLILGCDNDVDINKAEQMGFNVHKKDVLVSAALRGYHDPDSSEFML